MSLLSDTTLSLGLKTILKKLLRFRKPNIDRKRKVFMDHLTLYKQALKLHPDLWYATQLVERVQDHSVFPINTREELINVLLAHEINLKPQSHIKLEGMTLSSGEASKMFPLRYLPVLGQEDLLVKLYSAFVNMRELLLLEAKAKRMKHLLSVKGAGNV
jgi:hypothetical protein